MILYANYILADDCDIFISYSQIKAFQKDSPNSFVDANRLYNYLVKNGLKPWIDKNKPTFGDNLSREVLLALKRCTAIIPIVTRGYARSIQCARELYYFALLHPIQPCYSMMRETNLMEREMAGKWFIRQMSTLGCFNHRDAKQLISTILKLKVQICFKCGFTSTRAQVIINTMPKSCCLSCISDTIIHYCMHN